MGYGSPSTGYASVCHEGGAAVESLHQSAGPPPSANAIAFVIDSHSEVGVSKLI
jgi:hypothetical protein